MGVLIMWTIVIAGIIFGGQAQTGIGPFISQDACKAVASHVMVDAGKAMCVPIK